MNRETLTVTMKPLTSWGARKINGALVLVGKRQDGQSIQTSAVVRQLAPRVYETRSGSLYRLVGDPSEHYAAFRSITDAPRIDEDNPINFSPMRT